MAHDLEGYGGYVQVLRCDEQCFNDNYPMIQYLCNESPGYLKEYFSWCSSCQKPLNICKEEDCNDPNFFIDIACNELEDSNHHSIGNLPETLYNEIKDRLHSSNHLWLAKAIRESFKNIY